MTDAATSATELREFERSLPMALMRAREAVMRYFRPILAAHDITEQQWRVLRALGDSDDALGVGQLADRTYLLGPSLSRMLVSLVDRGLVARTAALDDARRSAVTITSAGRALVARVAPLSESAYAEIAGQLDDGELERLYALLARVGDL